MCQGPQGSRWAHVDGGQNQGLGNLEACVQDHHSMYISTAAATCHCYCHRL